MALTRVRDQSGIALFMVIAAMTVLAVLVTEFTYTAQVNSRMAGDGQDAIRAHYLAKSGLKLSLLRLKAYQNVKSILGSTGVKEGTIPKALLEKIWSFPFMYPLPTNIPGMTSGEKDEITKFQKSSGLDGSFTAVISSESAKYNLNMVLAPFAPSGPVPGASPSPTTTPTPPTPGSTATPSPTPSFDPAAARQSLQDYIGVLLDNKSQDDPDFSEQNQDFRLADLMDNLLAWMDRSYERHDSGMHDLFPPKRAPIYSLSELHMVPPINDQIYEVLAPNLTVSTTPGINVNTMQEAVLHALVPQMTKDEVEAFFKFRDSQEEDNSFKQPDDFYAWLKGNVKALVGDDSHINQFKDDLENKRRIRIVTDETEFKITVQAQVNQATRLIEAWVTLGSASGGDSSNPSSSPSPKPTPTPTGMQVPGGMENARENKPDPGLRITFMRIL